MPTVGAGKIVNGDRILFGPVKVPRPAVKLPADSVPVKIFLAGELELVGYRVDALPTASRPLLLRLWRVVRPAAEDWTAFFHLTPLSNDRELRGQMDQAITAHTYPPTVWSAGEVVEDHVQIGAANLQAGRYAVWMGLDSPATLERVAVEAGAGEVSEDRDRLLEFQIGP